jgi:DNA modification methylase
MPDSVNTSTTIFQGDCREVLTNMANRGEKVQMCVTSPPYFGLRDYGHSGQIGLEETPDEYVSSLVDIFRKVRDVLSDDGTLWLNLGDSYAGSGKGRLADGSSAGTGKQATNKGSIGGKLVKTTTPDCKPKDLIGIPWRVAFALQADGWYLRQDIIWHKPNPMPESVADRCTKAHEYIFLLTKSSRYFFDNEAIKTPVKDGCGMANRRSVWSVPTSSFKGAHFATFPIALIEPCVLAGSRKGDTVIDPFNGAGTTGVVCKQHHRNYIGIELNPEYVTLTENRLQ